MASYVTKFNLNDTAYIIDQQALNIATLIITDIRVREATNLVSIIISYRGRTTGTQQDFVESELYFLGEAKTALNILMAQRIADIGSMQ